MMMIRQQSESSIEDNHLDAHRVAFASRLWRTAVSESEERIKCKPCGQHPW